tara:strand:- start:2236 stop:2721 length:486 start_codon:yes stop_codon:yes gene_type:complete
MRLELYRYSSQKESTIGILFLVNSENKKEFLCYTLEDEKRTKKVYGETRIPSGQYFIELRTEGGYHKRYSQRFADIHRGMFEICDVHNDHMSFTHVLIHCGNTDDDTAGCLLVGDVCTQNVTKDGFLGQSTSAYKRIYPKILKVLEEQKKLLIKIINFEEN